MPWERSAARTFQQRKAIAQSCGHLLDPKRCGSGRGELDGERYAVELATDCRDRRQVSGA